MNRKMFTITLIALLALLLIVGGATGQGPEPEGEVQPEGGVSSAATVNSRISYQGVLKEDGTPVTDSRNMTFRLYTDEACSTMIGPPIKRKVKLTDGLFNVVLDVTHSDFNGQGLWLEVEVEGTVVADCQEILPAPYALSLRPGAEISDETSKVQLNHGLIKGVKSGIQAEVSGSHTVAHAVYGLASASDGTTYGVFGQSNSSDGTGVYGTAPDTGVQGYASATSGFTYGVYGESESPDGRGIYGTAPKTGVEGYASATSGKTYGVYGKSDSTSGRGVYGHTTDERGFTDGVRGESDSTSGRGVYGYATAHSGATHGVYGKSDSPSGTGVSGLATAHSGATHGVYGWSNSPSGTGVYGYVSANSSTAYGIYGHAHHGIGVYADGGYADIVLGGGSSGMIRSDPDISYSSIYLYSNNGVAIFLDSDGSGDHSRFGVYDRDDHQVFRVSDTGTTRVKVLQITGGSDLAESFEIADAESIVPGMVVAIDPEHPGQLRIADEAYDRTVAGCVSGANGINPGLTMEQEGTVAEGSLPVALSGRVYCWADASYGPIQPGDLLTTSDTPGHVMQVTDYTQAQGATIGKAMSSLEEGRGLILVLVSLQ